MFGLDEVMNVAKEQQQDNTNKRIEAVNRAFDLLDNKDYDLYQIFDILLTDNLYQYLTDSDINLIIEIKCKL